jgi:hypothetical protein
VADSHGNGDRDLKSPQEIGQLAGVSRWTVLRWARDPVCPLPAYRPTKSTVLISLTKFYAWLELRQAAPDLEGIATQVVSGLGRKR